MTTTLKKLAAGSYLLPGTWYQVERFPSGWRWLDRDNLHVGGEWRATKREAVLDLEAYLKESR